MVIKTAANDHNFYRNLKPFTTFSDVTCDRHYVPVPPGWFVIVTDLAIAEGRYKEVNMSGTGCIAAILNSAAGYDIPYLFGGDGAILLIPPALLNSATDALIAMRHMVENAFGLDIHIGVISVKELNLNGCRLLVAKYQMSRGVYSAMFKGGGLLMADSLIKSELGKHLLLTDVHATSFPNLTGLSQQWQSLPPLRDKMLTIMVMATASTACRNNRILLRSATASKPCALPISRNLMIC
jgi:hypothetical protein